jgi:hypothetical protein
MLDLPWLTRELSSKAQLEVVRPCESNGNKYIWSVYVYNPDKLPILDGYGKDYEHAMSCAIKARNYIVHTQWLRKNF